MLQPTNQYQTYILSVSRISRRPTCSSLINMSLHYAENVCELLSLIIVSNCMKNPVEPFICIFKTIFSIQSLCRKIEPGNCFILLIQYCMANVLLRNWSRAHALAVHMAEQAIYRSLGNTHITICPALGSCNY